MTNHRARHFKPLKWEDYEESAFARVKMPFQLDYHIASVGYYPDSTGLSKGYRVYTETDIDSEHIPYYANPGSKFPSIPEAKAYAEQHYQGVMVELEKAIEKLKIKRQ